MVEKNETELEKTEIILKNVESLVNKAENGLQDMLEEVVRTGDLCDNNIMAISTLTAKLDVLKEAANAVYYKKQRIIKNSGFMPDEDLDDGDDEPDSLFYRALAKDTKIRNIQFLYV